MSRYLVQLNRVDVLTLSGVISAGLSMQAALAGQFFLATGWLFLAMLGDALDGLLARRLGLAREFGRYLDGFMDVLIYLLAPSLLLYQAGFDGLWSLSLAAMVMAGCVRLAVFNGSGNIEEGGRLAYRGMPVFWSVFLLGGWLLVALWLPPLPRHLLLAALLLLFSHAMLLDRPFFKFSRLSHILLLTLGGAALFFTLHLAGVALHG